MYIYTYTYVCVCGCIYIEREAFPPSVLGCVLSRLKLKKDPYVYIYTHECAGSHTYRNIPPVNVRTTILTSLISDCSALWCQLSRPLWVNPFG